MKILKMHVYNYGKLSDFTLDFNDNLNVIKSDNGTGKTTITSFIKTMLYGISDNGKSVSTSTRMHYAPWNGNKFGGYLDISHNNKKYRIERTFNANNTTNDTFTLIDLDTNLKSSDYSSNIGYEILSLNSDSFERTLFIPQETQNKKYIEDSGFSDTIKSKILQILGGNLDASCFSDAITRLNNKNKELYKSKDSLYKLAQANFKETSLKIEEVKNSINAIDIINDNREELSLKISKLNERKLSLIEIEKQNFKNVELKSLEKVVDNYKERLSLMEKNIDDNRLKLNGYSQDSINILEIKRNIDKYNELKYKISNNDLNKLDLGYELIEPYMDLNNETLDGLLEDINKYNDITKKLKGKKNLMFIASDILFFICLVLGIIFTVLKNKLDVVFIVLSILFGIIGLILFYGRSKDIKLKKEYGVKLKDFFGKYNFYSDDYMTYLYNLKDKIITKERILREKENAQNNYRLLVNEYNQIEKEINEFFNRFNLNGVYIDEKLNELNNAILDINDKTFEYKRLLHEFNKYKEDNNIDETKLRIDSYDYDKLKKETSEIDSSLLELNNRLNTMNSNIERLNEKKALLGDLEEDLEKYKNQIDDINHKHRIIEMTLEELQKANTRLLNKYVKPISQRVDNYLSYFDYKEEYIIDSELNFNKNEKGIFKEMKYLSKGYQDIISFVMRISVIDSLYNEEVFIILDDPFVNYDEKALESINKLIVDLSDRYQIIYLTCHKSRNIER